MIGTYAAVLVVCGASLAIGQAALALCGARRWSWLSPALGLALLLALCWGTVRLPGEGATAAIAVFALSLAAVLFLSGRRVPGARSPRARRRPSWGPPEGAGEALRAGLPVALGALLAASLPFLVEGRFGILGTGFNPDMSQHLLAAERLAGGEGSQLLHEGYPLGPHAVVVALHEGLGIGLVQGFDGLTLAVAVLAPLTALAAFAELPLLRRTAAALLVGIPYLVASYYAQGAFKETMQALFVLAFVLALRESTHAWRDLPLRFLPAALIAAGSVYAYSFPGLIWPAGALLLWLLLERKIEPRPLLLALPVFAVLAAPEIGRMVDFGRFETFAPDGPGLGNLFGQVSPLEALGIWPSGDFRVAPGDGAAPAAAFYLGAAFALALLLHGIARCLRRGETAILAGLLAAAAVYAAARAGGTPYTAAKALEVAAPLATLTILLPLLDLGSAGIPRRFRETALEKGGSRLRFRGTASGEDQPRSRFRETALGLGHAGLRLRASASSAAFYLLAAGACSLLALANAPVGPATYTPALTGLRPLLAADSTLVLAPDRLLDEEHGLPYIAWELRGGRACIEPESAARGTPPPGVRFVIAADSTKEPPFPGLTLRRRAGPYLLWERPRVAGGPGPCPLIEVRQARQGPVP